MEALELDNLLKVSQRLSTYLHLTPVIRSASLEQSDNLKVFYKCENLQKTGSFKARGALNAVCLFDFDFCFFLNTREISTVINLANLHQIFSFCYISGY